MRVSLFVSVVIFLLSTQYSYCDSRRHDINVNSLTQDGNPKSKACLRAPTPLVNLDTVVYYRPGQFGQLTAKEYNIIDEVLIVLLDHPEIKIEVHGHSDNRGSEKFNDSLSYKRAEVVVGYLHAQIDKRPMERVIAVGMGSRYPKGDNATARGRALNRRVDFHLLDSNAVQQNQN